VQAWESPQDFFNRGNTSGSLSETVFKKCHQACRFDADFTDLVTRFSFNKSISHIFVQNEHLKGSDTSLVTSMATLGASPDLSETQRLVRLYV